MVGASIMKTIKKGWDVSLLSVITKIGEEE